MNLNLRCVALYTMLLTFIFLAIIAPLLGNAYYRRAYPAYQQHRWEVAADALASAERWEPFNAKYHQMRGEALINMGQYDDALQAYQLALRFKRDFAPFHAQLGWLFWLRGDLAQATAHFQKAVALDPLEAWRAGLHADLALAYVAQGRVQEAIPLFKQTIELNPHMTQAPYWVTTQDANGELYVALDPVYVFWTDDQPEKGKAALAARILGHLGKADYTPRVIALQIGAASTISFSQVLDAVEADYEAAQEARSLEAARLLATLAEASRLAGLHRRAESAYLQFQQAYPESVYGFRALGNLYREQGRLEEAQKALEQAVRMDPGNATVQMDLAEVNLERRAWTQAEQALKMVYAAGMLSPRMYTLQARFNKELGDLAGAAEALRKALFIQESIIQRLELAALYRQLDQAGSANEQCVWAAEALLKMWPRPLDSQLWDIGVCLAHMETLPETVLNLSHSHPLLGNVLLGHVYRARGELVQAIGAYQAASEARPDEGGPHFLLGETYQALGQLDLAETEYRLAAGLDPQESLPLLALGRMQWSMGSREEALLSFQAAVEVTPGWGEAHTALANALLALEDIDEANKHFHLAKLVDEVILEGEMLDFITSLADAEIHAPGSDYIRGDYFTINGMQRRVLFMHPDSSAGYSVTLPDEPGVGLSFDLGTAPDSWSQPGDGVAFTVSVISENETRQIFSKYIDPKNNPSDRRWHSETIDLTPYRGKTITLAFETNAGPEGDNRYDWAGWGEARLLHPAKNSILQAQEEILHAP